MNFYSSGPIASLARNLHPPQPVDLPPVAPLPVTENKGSHPKKGAEPTTSPVRSPAPSLRGRSPAPQLGKILAPTNTVRTPPRSTSATSDGPKKKVPPTPEFLLKMSANTRSPIQNAVASGSGNKTTKASSAKPTTFQVSSATGLKGFSTPLSSASPLAAAPPIPTIIPPTANASSASPFTARLTTIPTIIPLTANASRSHNPLPVRIPGAHRDDSDEYAPYEDMYV